nr:membrane protein insertion efficiency factor YidD [Pseudovibrio sp. M1P-2-3]
MFFIRIYQHSLSLLIGRACRYAPTCSHYTEQAIRRFGFWAGGWMGLARILRCNPFGGSGFDPVPNCLPHKARWFMPWRYGYWNSDHIDPSTRLE